MKRGKAAPTESRSLLEFMRQMGSKNGFDPIAPSQHAYLLDIDQPAENRAIAWVWSKGTVHPDKRRKHYLCAHDERGDLTLKHAASDLGWHLSNTIRTFKQLEDAGRIRRDDQGRIFLEGDAPEPRRILSEDQRAEQDAENELHICTDMCDPAMSLFFQQLNKMDFDRCTRDYKSVKDYRKRIEAEALAAARAQGQELEDNWRKAAGAPLPERKGRPRQERPQTAVQLSLVALPQLSVQISSLPSVQNDLSPSVQNENRSVQITASLLNKTETIDKTLTSAPEEIEHELSVSSSSEQSPPATPTTTDEARPEPSKPAKAKPAVEADDERRIVAEAVMPYAIPDRQATAELLEKCRRAAPEVTAEEIAAAIHDKAPLSKGPRPIGFLLTAVPAVFADGGLELIRSRAPSVTPQPAAIAGETSIADQIQSLVDLLDTFPNHELAQQWQRELERLKKQ